MMTTTTLRLIPAVALLAATTCFAEQDARTETPNGKGLWRDVSGTAIHYFDDVPGRNVITHEVRPTSSGEFKRTTDTIDLFGDLEGRVLYQPETEIDYAECSLVNTGNQVFSGTVLGEGPVLLHDDLFRFEVDICTGETVGKAFLVDRIDGPFVDCVIDIVGTGFTEEGNGLAEYSGRCRVRGQATRRLR